MNRTDHPLPDPQAQSGLKRGIAPTLNFAGFRLEPDGSLFRGGSLVHLPPRELAALRLLLESAGQIVTASQLKQALWGNVNVTADSVPKCVSSLRNRLHPEDFIQTVYKRGYRLLADVKQSGPLPLSFHALPRLAVLPFTSGPGVPEHLGTAIAEELIYRLSNASHPHASILARDSVFTLAEHGRTAQQVGDALNADLVLVGNLRALSVSYRLRIEMIRVADGVQIWVEDILVESDVISGLESDLAGRLDFRLRQWPMDRLQAAARAIPSASALAQLVDSSHGAALIDPTADVPVAHQSTRYHLTAGNTSASESLPASTDLQRREAHELFLRGHHEWHTLERHRMQDGLQKLQRAIELDPHHLAARIDLVQLCSTQALYGFMSPAAAAGLIRGVSESVPDFPRQANAILPDLAWVHLHFDRNLPAALWAFELSTLLRHDLWITRMRTMFSLSRHRFAEAIAQINTAVQLDPFSPWLHNRLSWALHLDGQAEASVASVEHTLRLFPDHEATFLYGSMILSHNGEVKRGVHMAEELVKRQPYFDPGQAILAYTLASAGRAAEAKAVLERLQWLSRERFVISSFTPAVHVALGDLDAAAAELSVTNNNRCPWFFQTLADPRLTPLRDHPTYRELGAILPAMEATLQS